MTAARPTLRDAEWLYRIKQDNLGQDFQDRVTALEERTLTAGVGLDGGGDLSADRTFDLADTAVTPGGYGGAATVATFTVDQQGRLTAAADVAVAISAGAVSGLADIATSGSATDLTTGTVPDARLSSNVALYDATTANFTGTLQAGGSNVLTEADPRVIAVGSVTLDASPATTTNVTVSGLLATDEVFLMPTTAAAASLDGLVHVTPGAGSFDITHSDGPAGRSYAWLAVRG